MKWEEETEQRRQQMGCCNSYLAIDLGRVKDNCERVRRHIGEKVEIIPVLKGNCYGYGLVPMAMFYWKQCGAKLLANAAVWEAAALREAGVSCPLLIIGGVPQHLIDQAVQMNLQLPLFDLQSAERMNREGEKAGRKVKVHLKIETGMNRLGVRPGKPLEQLLALIRTLPWLEIEGVYTHFATATAETGDSFTLEQHGIFQKALKQLRSLGVCPKYIHCCNSAAISWFSEAYHTHVRSCSSILGHAAMEDGTEPLGLEEPVTLRTFVTNVHSVSAGESVGYSRYFPVERPMRIATLSIGFADGIYPPWAKNQGPVLINGCRTRFLGICMDQSFVDVTDLSCAIGDLATLIGRDGSETISTREIEVFTGNTFEYLFGTFGSRMARIYEGTENMEDLEGMKNIEGMKISEMKKQTEEAGMTDRTDTVDQTPGKNRVRKLESGWNHVQQ